MNKTNAYDTMTHVLPHQIELDALVESKHGLRGIVKDLVSTPTGVELEVKTANGVVTWKLNSKETILHQAHPLFANGFEEDLHETTVIEEQSEATIPFIKT